MKKLLCLVTLCLTAITLTRSVSEAGPRDEAKTTTITTADGMKLVCDTQGQGDTALVFLHGWCGDRHWWKHQMPVFARNYTVVAIDQAGHGESGKDRKAWSVDQLASDVKSVVEKLGLKKVILVGHSMGGQVSLAAASKLPGIVIGVVGVDTLHNVENKTPEDQVKMFMEMFDKDFAGTMAYLFKGMLPEKTDPDLVKWILSGAARQDKTIALAHMKSLLASDAGKLMKDAKVPVRCINAAPGTLQFSQKTTVDINQKYGDFNTVIMEGVGHFPMLEKPSEFNEKLTAVVKELAK